MDGGRIEEIGDIQYIPLPQAVARPGVSGNISFIPVAKIIFLLRYSWPSLSVVVKYDALVFPSGTIEVTVPFFMVTVLLYAEICWRARARKALGTVPSLPMTSCIC